MLALLMFFLAEQGTGISRSIAAPAVLRNDVPEGLAGGLRGLDPLWGLGF